MRRFWIGVVILAVLLGTGIWTAVGIPKLQEGISQKLRDACEAAQKEDWEAALDLAEAAEAQWERWRHMVASLIDHEPLEELDGMFAELKIYKNGRLPVDYAAVCSHLAHLSEAVGESQALKWWNLL